MVHDMCSSRKAKDDENNKGKQTSEKGTINLGTSVSDTSLKWSAQETPSKKMIPSPLSTRKSERLQRLTPSTPAVRRKSERLGKQKMPSPLRRSERNKKHSSLTSSNSKSSGSSDSNQKKPKKEKSVKQLTFETTEVNENVEHNVGISHETSKSRHARAYRAMFKIKAKIGSHGKKDRMDKSIQEVGNNDRDKIDEFSKGSDFEFEEVPKSGNYSLLPSDDAKAKGMRANSRLSGLDGGDYVEVSKGGSFSSVPSNAPTNETSGAPEIVWVDSSGDETLQMLATRNSILDEGLVRNSVGNELAEKLTPSKRKGIVVDMHSDSSARNVCDDNCNLIADVALSRLCECKAGNVVGTCSERIRMDHDLTVQEGFNCNNKESVSPSAIEKLDQGSFVSRLSQMPGGISSAFGVDNLDAVNKLREHWRKGQNAIVIDGHDRIVKVIAFILSLHIDTNRPFLIISTSAALRSWKDEFSHLAPSVNVVIHSGTKEMHKSIRRLEYYDEGCCILFKVLVIVPEVIIEDLDVLGGIQWEAVIVDECQCSEVSSSFKQIKMLNTYMRILLFSGQLKDSIVEYHNILALLVHQSDNEKDDGLISNSSDSIAQLKERLLSYIAYRCKFVEYWVPVQISSVQLEKYCSILLSNASALRSSSKADVVEALHDILISTRKCCNHPYIVDKSLQVLLTKDLKEVEYLDVGTKASGKLQLLDSMLMVLKKQGLRGLVLYQSIGGSGRDSIGDILEDFLHLRFGQDSYERIDKAVQRSKKLAAMNLFNDKDSGRFILLLETCACLPSIKLLSVDTIIIFDSDWNPMNDIRSLQRITFDSPFGQIKIFRLYSSLTVEEKALIFAKQDKTLDSNLHNISWSACHMLLMWGAPALFDYLKVFHDGRTCSSSLDSLSGNLLLKAVYEFSSLLLQDGDTSNCSVSLKVKQFGVTYRTKSPLIGEQIIGSQDEGPSHIFWTELLEGKHPQWKYSCDSSQWSRKRVRHFDGLSDKADFESEDIAKKRVKVINNVVDQPSSKSKGNFGDPVGSVSQLSPNSTACVSDQMPERAQGDSVSEYTWKLRDEQRSLLLSLKPEIAKLCQILHLPANVQSIVDDFLKYVMSYHRVNREPVSVLQAFQISLCWTAASMLKYKIDYKASLMLAKQHLHFDCKKEEADYIYSMLRCLKNIFLYRTGYFNVTGSPKACELSNRVYSCTGVAQEVELVEKDILKSIKEIEKKCQKQLKKLVLKQEEEKLKLKTTNEEENADLERKYKIESAVIRSYTLNHVIRTEKLKILDYEYAKRVEEMNSRHETLLKNLEAVQSEARKKFLDREVTWVEEVKSWARDELSNIFPSHRLRTGVGISEIPETIPTIALRCSIPVKLQTPLGKLGNANEMDAKDLDGRSLSRNEDHNRAENLCHNQVTINSMHSQFKEQNSDKAINIADEGDAHENFNCDNCRVDTMTLLRSSSDGEACDEETLDVSSGKVSCEGCKTSSSTDVPDEYASSRQGKLDGTILSMPDCGFSIGEVKAAGSTDNLKTLNSLSSEENVTSQIARCMPNCEDDAQNSEADDDNCSNNVLTLNSPLSNERNVDGATVSVLRKELHMGMPGNVNFTDCPDNVNPVNPPSSTGQLPYGSLVNVSDGELSSRVCETASPSSGPDDVSVPKSLSSDQQILNGVSSTIPNGQIPVEVPETSHEVAECHNDREHQTDHILLDKTTASDLQEEVSRSINENTLSLETSVLSLPSVQPLVISSPTISVNEELQDPHSPSSSSCRLVDEDATVGEMHNSSQQVEPASSPVDVVAANHQLNHESLVIVPPEQVQKSPPAEPPSFNQDTAGALHKSSQQVELISSPVDVPATQSNHESQVTEPLGQMRKLPSAELPSSKQKTADKMQNCAQVESDCTAVDVVPTNQSNHELLVMEPREQVQQLPSEESPSSYQDTAEEMQNSAQQIDPESSAVDVAPTNQSNHESLAMEPLEKVQQLPSADSPSSNQDPAEEVWNSAQQGETASIAVDVVVTNQSNHESLVMEPPEPVQQLPSAEPPVQQLPSSESHSNQDTGVETQNSSQQVEPVSSATVVIVIPANQSSNESLVMEPLEEVQLLPSAVTPSSNEDPSTLATGIEHQPANEDTLPSHVSQVSIEVPNQAVLQPASNSVLDSHTAVGGFRMHPSDRRNMPTPSEINNHNMQIATQSASRMPLPLYSDPLGNELERIRKETEQTMKNLEDMKLQLKSDCEREIEETRRKYDIKLQDAEVEFQQKKNHLDTSLNIVHMNQILAEAFRSKCMDLRVSGASGMQRDASFAQQLVQLSRQQSAIRPSPVAAGPPAASLQSISTTASSQNIVPSIQAVYNTSGIFPSVSTRPPHINSISPPSGNLQAVSERRAPAPLLQSYRPSTSMPATSLPTLPPALSSQQAPSNILDTSSSFPHIPPQQTTPSYQTPSNRGHWPENAGVLSTPNLSAREVHMDGTSQSSIDLPSVLSHMSDATFRNVVCLSDDD